MVSAMMPVKIGEGNVWERREEVQEYECLKKDGLLKWKRNENRSFFFFMQNRSKRYAINKGTNEISLFVVS